jgi:hypothetical protein
LQIVEMDAAALAGREAAQRDDSRAAGGPQQRQQMRCEREVAEMIAAEL